MYYKYQLWLIVVKRYESL